MKKYSKASRNSAILERPKGRFSIEDEFLTPSTYSNSPAKPFASGARARVQALTSKLSTSASKLDSDSHYLLDETSSCGSSDDKNDQRLTARDIFSGKLRKDALSTPLPAIQSYDDGTLSLKSKSKDNLGKYTGRGISWGAILAPKKIGSLGTDTSSRSTNDLSEQRTSRTASKESAGTIYTSLIDLRSEDSDTYSIARSRPTPSPRTSLYQKESYILGSEHDTGLNSQHYRQKYPTNCSGPTALSCEENSPKPRVDIGSAIPSHSTSINDYPAEKDPFALVQSLQKPSSSDVAPSEEKPCFRWQSTFTASISSDPTRIFEREATSGVPPPPTKPADSWHGAENSACNIPNTVNGSISRGTELGILSLNDRSVSINSGFPSRAEKKSSVLALPYTKASEDAGKDRPKIHRAQTDLQYSFLQAETALPQRSPYSSADSLYLRPEIKTHPARSGTESNKSPRNPGTGPELRPTTSLSNLPLMSFVDDFLSPKQRENPPPLPSVPPPDDDPIKPERKNSIAELSAGFGRWSKRILSPEEPPPLIELTRNENVGATTAQIGTNIFKVPLKKLAPNPSEERVLRQGTAFDTATPARRVLTANEDENFGRKPQGTRKEDSMNFQNVSQQDSSSTLPVPQQRGDSQITTHDRNYWLDTGSGSATSRRSAASSKSATLPAMHLNTGKEREARNSRPQSSVESLFEDASSNKFPHSPLSLGRSPHRFPSSNLSKTSVHNTSGSTNPFGSSDIEFFDEAKPSIFDRGSRDGPLQSSTPNGTLKKKFGGTGLLQAWSNDFSISASEMQLENSFNRKKIGYHDNVDSAEGSIESLRALSINEGRNENNPFNPFFDGANDDSADSEYIDPAPLRPPRRNRAGSQSRNSLSCSSMEELQPNDRLALEEPIADSTVEEEASKETIHDDESEESIDLNLSRPLPPLPPPPPLPALSYGSKLPYPDASKSLQRESSQGREFVLNPTQGEELEPIVVGKLAASVCLKPIRTRPDVEVTRVENPTATGCDETQKPSDLEKESADLDESGPQERTVQKQAKPTIANKRKKRQIRFQSRERAIRPRKSRSIVIQYIYNTTAPVHEIASKTKLNDDASSSPRKSRPQTPELCLDSDPSSEVELLTGSSQVLVEPSEGSTTDSTRPTVEHGESNDQILSENMVDSNTPEQPKPSKDIQGARSLSEFPESFGIEDPTNPTGSHESGRGPQQDTESRSPDESYIQESSSTSETSYDTDPEDRDFTISTPEYTEMSRKRALSVIHEYSEDESFETKVPSVVEHLANLDEGFFFVETVQEDGDEFRVHSVIHDDSDILDLNGSRGCDADEETGRDETSNAFPAKILKNNSKFSEAAENRTEQISNNENVDLKPAQAIKELADSSENIGDVAGVERLRTGAETTETEAQAEAPTTLRNGPFMREGDSGEERPIQIETEITEGRNTIASNRPMQTMGHSQPVQSDIGSSEDPSTENTEPSGTKKFRVPADDDSKETLVVSDESKILDDAGQPSPAELSKLHGRPATLPLTEQLSQASMKKSDALCQRDCGLRDLPINQEELHNAVAIEHFLIKMQIKHPPALKPSESIELPSIPQTPSYDDADDVKVDPDSLEADAIETMLPPRTLPLPPIELISRRYSEGDVSSSDKRSSYRKCSRRNSASPPANASFVDVDLRVPAADHDDGRGHDSRTPPQRPDPDTRKRTQKSTRRPGIAPPRPPSKTPEAIEGVSSQPESICSENRKSEESSKQKQMTKSLSERFAEVRASQEVTLPELFSSSAPTPSSVQVPRVSPQRRPAPPVPAPRHERQSKGTITSKKSGLADFHFHPPPSLGDTSVGFIAEERTVGHSQRSQGADAGFSEAVDSASTDGNSEPAIIAVADELPLQGNVLEGAGVSPASFVASSFEENERRSSGSSQAERIFGRSISITKGSDKLLLQCRQIEEQQANLSAEARLVERQLYEATKDTALRGDLPRLDLDQETGKYKVSNEVSLELLPETLVADLYRILNVKNQLVEKHREIKFLQLYNELQREQLEVEARLRSLGSDKGDCQADVDYERALINKLLEIVEQRNKMIEAMDGDFRRTTPLGDLSRSDYDITDDPLPSNQSSKTLTTPPENTTKSGTAHPTKKRKGVRHFVKKRYKRVFK